jgi:NAD(P)-dependent dehydrogenase (short-subunit alcohol dehydrogenase family)
VPRGAELDLDVGLGDQPLRFGVQVDRAYCQSKLAQIMFTIDLAEELHDRGVTANCLHPATYMPTKICSPTAPARSARSTTESRQPCGWSPIQSIGVGYGGLGPHRYGAPRRHPSTRHDRPVAIFPFR